MTVLQSLRAIDDGLADWLIFSIPRNETERTTMKHVLDLRGQLAAAIQTAIAKGLTDATRTLPADEDRVKSAAASMARVSRSIDSAQTVLTVAGTAVSIAASVLGQL